MPLVVNRSTVVANACTAVFIQVLRFAVDGILAVCRTSKVDATIIQTTAVPMVNDSPTARGNDHIMHVNILLSAIRAGYRARSIEGVRFWIPSRIPRKSTQFIEVGFIDKGKLPLSQRDAAIWSGPGQPQQAITRKGGE